jgi:EAL domain-containing protein (putative c-di-GMP-specific phosphodiesterase class I)
MVARRHGEMRWVSRLNEALENRQFALYAQPIAALSSDLAPRSEILLRLHNGNQVILPGAFIPAAERYDLMTVIDRWVIDTAFRSMREYSQQRRQDANAADRLELGQGYSINLSGISLNDDTLYDYIVEKLRYYGIDAGRICFEVTETAVINNLAKAHLFMEKTKQLGCKFSLDDFGIGLSSFAYLKQLPVDYLKIDGLFVRDIATNAINRAMVSAINDVGHVMGLKTIAEFVETDEILDEVRKIGLDFAQGYAVGTLQPLDGS